MYCSGMQPDINFLILSACYFHVIFLCEPFPLPYPGLMSECFNQGKKRCVATSVWFVGVSRCRDSSSCPKDHRYVLPLQQPAACNTAVAVSRVPTSFCPVLVSKSACQYRFGVFFLGSDYLNFLKYFSHVFSLSVVPQNLY